MTPDPVVTPFTFPAIPMFCFDEMKLVADLERLPSMLRVAFAAACAERQMPAYRTFVAKSHMGNATTISQALDDAWTNPTKGGVQELQRQLQDCMANVPKEHLVKVWTAEATYAQNAGMSVLYTLRVRINGQAREAAWSARVAYESLDHFVIDLDDIDTNLPGGETCVLSHPLVQAELARQRRDLNDLLGASGQNLEHIVVQVRDRAKSASRVFFAPES